MSTNAGSYNCSRTNCICKTWNRWSKNADILCKSPPQAFHRNCTHWTTAYWTLSHYSLGENFKEAPEQNIKLQFQWRCVKHAHECTFVGRIYHYPVPSPMPIWRHLIRQRNVADKISKNQGCFRYPSRPRVSQDSTKQRNEHGGVFFSFTKSA